MAPTIAMKPKGKPNTQSAPRARPIERKPTAAITPAWRNELKANPRLAIISTTSSAADAIRLRTARSRCSLSPPIFSA